MRVYKMRIITELTELQFESPVLIPTSDGKV